MREHIFRGKNLYGDEWIEGDLLTHGIGFDYAIRISDKKSKDHGFVFAVNPDTTCEFTGQSDKNDEPIFEGSIVRILYTDWPSKPDDDPRTLDEYLHDIAEVGVVVWGEKDCGFFVQIGNTLCSLVPGLYGYIEVIGNRFDNPELLENKK